MRTRNFALALLWVALSPSLVEHRPVPAQWPDPPEAATLPPIAEAGLDLADVRLRTIANLDRTSTLTFLAALRVAGPEQRRELIRHLRGPWPVRASVSMHLVEGSEFRTLGLEAFSGLPVLNDGRAARIRSLVRDGLRDPDAEVRLAASRAGGRWVSPEMAPLLVAVVGDATFAPADRTRALSAAMRAGADPDEVWGLYRSLLLPNRNDRRALRTMMDLFGRFGDRRVEALPELRELLRSSPERGVSFVLRELGQLGPPAREAIPDLVSLAGRNDPGPDGPPVSLVLRALAKIDVHSREAIDLAEDLRDHDSYDVRVAAFALLDLHRRRPDFRVLNYGNAPRPD